MNCTVRVSTSAGSFIVKQSRPWVEKYPQFAAPWDRACREAEFYQLVVKRPSVASMMPGLLSFDAEARVLVLEDLGAASDCTGIYRGGSFATGEIESLAKFLSALHGSFEDAAVSSTLANREMRELNHAHIFAIPLTQKNGLDLDSITSGLSDVAESLQADAAYCGKIKQLGREVYLADGQCLLHGDFFPGSLLRTGDGPRVIDPEFGFFGRPEFDVAVFLAHLYLAQQSEEHRLHWRREYDAPAGFDEELMLQLAGVEIMRRLIGYAQLPLGYGLKQKRQLVELSRNLVLEPRTCRLAHN